MTRRDLFDAADAFVVSLADAMVYLAATVIFLAGVLAMLIFVLPRYPTTAIVVLGVVAMRAWQTLFVRAFSRIRAERRLLDFLKPSGGSSNGQ